ncbi:MAG: hypothetical protein GDA48_08550 [Hormoscilla sp. GM102CHS1]|nr:hypothetical protein [Hormoscilla sp. GM102CHS1]
MNNHQFHIQLGEVCLENSDLPPSDPLGELSDFELGLRRFCYEQNRPVAIAIRLFTTRVFLYPDICMMLEDNFPEQIALLSEGKNMQMEFAESCWQILKSMPRGQKISCHIGEFGYSLQSKTVELDKDIVLEVLRGFLNDVMQMAVDKGYITQPDKEAFIRPAFVTPLVGRLPVTASVNL